MLLVPPLQKSREGTVPRCPPRSAAYEGEWRRVGGRGGKAVRYPEQTKEGAREVGTKGERKAKAPEQARVGVGRGPGKAREAAVCVCVGGGGNLRQDNEG